MLKIFFFKLYNFFVINFDPGANSTNSLRLNGITLIKSCFFLNNVDIFATPLVWLTKICTQILKINR